MPKIKETSFDVFELEIPKKYYPKIKNNKSKAYATKVKDMITKLHNLEMNLEFCLLNIRDYKKILDKRYKSERPVSLAYINDLNRKTREFHDEYENYCLRVFIYRETIWHFVAAFLDVKNDNFFFSFLKDSKIRELKLDKILYLFDEGELKKIIALRNKITHKIPEINQSKKRALDDLIKRFEQNVKLVNKTLSDMIKINKKIVVVLNDFKKDKCLEK